MKLRAVVKEATEHYQAYYGVVIDNPLRLIAGDKIPCPAYIEIVEDIERGETSYLILYYDKNGEFLTDSWCQTMKEAKEQARLEFSISDDDWIVVEP